MSKKTTLWHRILEGWGWSDVFKRQTPVATGEALRVFWLRDPEPVAVGHVVVRDGKYRFEYDPAFCKRDDAFPVIPAFPELSKAYESEKLWPFFTVRLPPLERADARRLLEERKIDPDQPKDQLRLLEALGGKSPVSPFEFRLAASG